MKTKSFKISSLALLLPFLLAFAPAERTATRVPAQQVVQDLCNSDNTSFRPGEEITYKLYYNWNFVWVSAGEVTFRVRDKGSQYHFSAIGKTYPSYEWFYKVYDKYDTYVNKETLLPELSIRDIKEGDYRMYDKIRFDQHRHIARGMRGKTKATAQAEEYQLEDCMHDLLSMVYYIRNVDYHQLKKGDTVPIEIFMDQETWPLKVRYLGKEKNKKVKGLGRFNTVKINPEVILGDIFTEESKLHIWATDDRNRVPLIIESPISVGSVKAVLKDYKGLRHDFSSAVAWY